MQVIQQKQNQNDFVNWIYKYMCSNFCLEIDFRFDVSPHPVECKGHNLKAFVSHCFPLSLVRQIHHRTNEHFVKCNRKS